MISKLEELILWCKTNNVPRYEYSEPVNTIDSAERISGFSKSVLIKSLLMKNKDTNIFILAIIPAGSKVDKKQLQNGISPKRWSLATPQEVFEITGFPIGGVPPITFDKNLTIFVDPRIMKREFIVAGGGTQNSLIKVNPNYIISSGGIEKVISFG